MPEHPGTATAPGIVYSSGRTSRNHNDCRYAVMLEKSKTTTTTISPVIRQKQKQPETTTAPDIWSKPNFSESEFVNI
jgi:hypothetical protein